jgi:VIT1/CCC1 family predicted Fe2+/Mn2+ transporter
MNHLRVSGEVLSSVENLRNVVTGESKEISTMYPRMVKDALDDGRMDAKDTFTLAMDRERHHLEVFSKALAELEARQTSRPEVSTPSDGAAGTARRPDPLRVEAEASPTYAKARKEVEGERWRVAAAGRIREVVFGAQDGLVSTVALVTGVAVAGADNAVVLVAGLAGALAGVISMGTGAYLGSRAEQDVQRGEIAQEAAELAEHPAEELAELVVLYQREGLSFEEAKGVAEHIAADKDLWLTTMVEKELGLSYEETVNPVKDAVAMGAAFIAGAVVPVLPYFFAQGTPAITASVTATLVGLFVLGIGKGRIVRQSPVVQGIEVLLIGAVSAGAGFGLGLIV